MNPIANLPATQNLNKAQQSQGYNRQYFGGDEVDEVVLSNQEEQKKKKAWTIGGAILGAIALIGGGIFGANYFGYMGKDAKHLKGFKTLTTKNGDTTQELASIAKTTKAWTGASWGGVAETIKTTLDGKNDTKFKKIVLVASEDSQKALKESLGEDLFKKLTVIQANSDKIEDAVKQAAVHGKDKDNLIITDSSIDNLYDEIEKAIAPSDNSEKTEDAKEEKKAEKEQNPTEAPKTTETEKKEEEKKTEKNEEPPKPEVKQQPNVNVDGKFYGVELNSDENAQKIFNSLQKDMEKAFNDMKMCNNAEYITLDNLEENVNIFEKQHKDALKFEKTMVALKTYCKQTTEVLSKANEKLDKKLQDEYTTEKRNEKMNTYPDVKAKEDVAKEFDNEKETLKANIKANQERLQKLNNITDYFNENNSFSSNYNTNYNNMLKVSSDRYYYKGNKKNKIIYSSLLIQKNLNETISNIEQNISELEKQKASVADDLLTSSINKEDLDKKISDKKNELADKNIKLKKTQENIKKAQNTLRRLYNIFAEDYKERETKEAQEKANDILNKAKTNIETIKQEFEESIQ